MPKGRPKARVSPQPRKGARSPSAVVGIPDHDDERPPLFSFEYADREYAGAWKWPTNAEAGQLLRFLCEVSQSRWIDIMTARNSGGTLLHHEQAIDTVCEAAQARITELGHDERFEALFRFAVDDRKRLWGFVTKGVFYVLWWDWDHHVYPLPDRQPRG
jgi:hypothetical protein